MLHFTHGHLCFELISINQATRVLPCTMDCNLFGLLFSLCVHLFVFMFHYHFSGPMPPPAPPTSGDNSADTAAQPWQQGVLTSHLITIISIIIIFAVPPFGAGLLPPPFGFPLPNMVNIYFWLSIFTFYDYILLDAWSFTTATTSRFSTTNQCTSI